MEKEENFKHVSTKMADINQHKSSIFSPLILDEYEHTILSCLLEEPAVNEKPSTDSSLKSSQGSLPDELTRAETEISMNPIQSSPFFPSLFRPNPLVGKHHTSLFHSFREAVEKYPVSTSFQKEKTCQVDEKRVDKGDVEVRS